MNHNAAGERLNKYLASCGVGSRRHCDTLIQAGLVMVDGEKVTRLGVKIVPGKSLIEVDGKRVGREKKAYFVLNKPKGAVCTNAHEEGKMRAVDFIREKGLGRLYTVGRLDTESEGLLLITNDGELTHRLTHPRFGIPKTYHVVLRGMIGPEDLEKAMKGIYLEEGRTRSLKAEVRKRSRGFSTLRITLQEGKNREIRRIFAKLGFKVKSLKRIKIGPLNLASLPPGAYRPLTRAELKQLTSRGSSQSR